MSEDRFFQQVNAAMTDYSPEVPASVYTGMRKKLWWSNFTRLSATRFNVWYAALILTGGLAWFAAGNAKTSSLPADAASVNETTIVESSVLEASAGKENQTAAEATSTENPKPTAAAVNPKSTANTEAVALKDEPTTQSNQPDLMTETSTTEGQVMNEPSANQSESTQIKQGSKKGLKVKTFNSTDKK
jgi:cytoskeletal protein RodZ